MSDLLNFRNPFQNLSRHLFKQFSWNLSLIGQLFIANKKEAISRYPRKSYVIDIGDSIRVRSQFDCDLTVIVSLQESSNWVFENSLLENHKKLTACSIGLLSNFFQNKKWYEIRKSFFNFKENFKRRLLNGENASQNFIGEIYWKRRGIKIPKNW